MASPLVSCEEAALHLDDAAWAFFDCRHELAEPDKGLREYAKLHIPGAFFAHVDRDLSGPVGDGHRGRHPLPLAFARFLQVHGVGKATRLVAYDDGPGNWASRLWWLARHHGVAGAAVLDGGLTRWKALKLPVRSGHEKPRTTGRDPLAPGGMPLVATADIEAGKVPLVLDARAPERYRGDVEPVDKRAGHIPGAVSLPFAGNVGPDGRFLAPEALRSRYEAAGFVPGAACYCGSGVTGTQLVLAAEVAGLPTPALYPDSWSGWSYRAAARPIKTGPEP